MRKNRHRLHPPTRSSDDPVLLVRVAVGGQARFAKRLAGAKFFDFHAEADAAIAVGFVAHMHYAGCTARFFRHAARDFDGHTQRGFNRRANLQRRR